MHRGPAPVLIVSGPRRERHGDARNLRPSGAMRGLPARIRTFGKYTLVGFIAWTPSAPLCFGVEDPRSHFQYPLAQLPGIVPALRPPAGKRLLGLHVPSDLGRAFRSDHLLLVVR